MNKYIILAVMALAIAAPSFAFAQEGTSPGAEHREMKKEEHKKHERKKHEHKKHERKKHEEKREEKKEEGR